MRARCASLAALAAYILRLDVAVQDLAVVDVLHGEAELHKVVEHLRLGQVARPLRLQQASKVATLGVVHHDVEHACLEE